MERDEEYPLLIAQAGPLNGHRWTLSRPLLIGRDASCDIVIADRQVSRHHARFLPSYKGVVLEDLRSKNGTHWNGQIIQEPALLQDGDVIQIALAQQFVFLSSDATVPLDANEIDMQLVQSAQATAQAQSELLRLEKRSRRVWIGEKEILPPLSVSQFRMLELLYEQPGRVVSRQDLIANIWGEEQAVEVSEQALDALIRRLRDRLASIDPTHAYIVTIRGHGLRLDNPRSG